MIRVNQPSTEAGPMSSRWAQYAIPPSITGASRMLWKPRVVQGDSGP